jgi:hypothetical protein
MKLFSPLGVLCDRAMLCQYAETKNTDVNANRLALRFSNEACGGGSVFDPELWINAFQMFRSQGRLT